MPPQLQNGNYFSYVSGATNSYDSTPGGAYSSYGSVQFYVPAAVSGQTIGPYGGSGQPGVLSLVISANGNTSGILIHDTGTTYPTGITGVPWGTPSITNDAVSPTPSVFTTWNVWDSLGGIDVTGVQYLDDLDLTDVVTCFSWYIEPSSTAYPAQISEIYWSGFGVEVANVSIYSTYDWLYGVIILGGTLSTLQSFGITVPTGVQYYFDTTNGLLWFRCEPGSWNETTTLVSSTLNLSAIGYIVAFGT
jgi:hypothetical protein